jgi:hypothetical protein
LQLEQDPLLLPSKVIPYLSFMSLDKQVAFLSDYLTKLSLVDIFGRRWDSLMEMQSTHHLPSQAFQLAHEYLPDNSMDQIFDKMMTANRIHASDALSFFSNHIKSEYYQAQLSALISHDYSDMQSYSYPGKFISNKDLNRIQLLQYCFLHDKYLLLGLHEIHLLIQQLFDESDGMKLFPIQLALYAYIIPTACQRDYFDVLLPLSTDMDDDARMIYEQEYKTSHFWRSYISAMEVSYSLLIAS